jgi:hypothetical protein
MHVCPEKMMDENMYADPATRMLSLAIFQEPSRPELPSRGRIGATAVGWSMNLWERGTPAQNP